MFAIQLGSAVGLFCITLLCGSAATASASTAPQSIDGNTIVLNTSDLRSAFLLRAGYVHYDSIARSPQHVRQQLVRHFDVVLGMLVMSTPRSIELALDRLEAANDRSWSAVERNAWRRRLLFNRYVQVLRLKAYRDRGLFPINEGQARRPTPIFVDRHDIACAVGHLMRLSGWNEHVARIREANNLVYVSDALASPLARWLLNSGLTWEEAALIQPAYNFPAEFDFSDYGPGGAAWEENGLRFENFDLELIAGTANPNRPHADGLGVLTGVGDYYGPDFGSPEHHPMGTHWIAVGGYHSDFLGPFLVDPDTYLHSLGALAFPGSMFFRIHFDVSTIAPHQRINQIAQTSYVFQSGFQRFSSDPFDIGQFSLYTTVSSGPDLISDVYFDDATSSENEYNFQLADSAVFAPRQRITVDSYIALYDSTQLDTYLLDFNVVPEPPALAISVVGLVGLFFLRTVRRVSAT